MTELEIYDTILELEDLLDKILIKISSKEIKSIVERYNKYYMSSYPFDIKSLRNATLENKVKNTPLQATLISMINDLGLPSDYQQIYAGLPYSIEEQAEYVTTLKNNYKLANKCYNLIIEIEKLSEIEYEISDEDMKNSEYASFIEHKNNVYVNLQAESQPVKQALPIIRNYLENLSLEQKQKLYCELIPLCYNRNVFDYLNQEILVFQYALFTNIGYSASISLYTAYQHLLPILLLNDLSQNHSLQEIYSSISEVHNSKYVKELIRKK